MATARPATQHKGLDKKDVVKIPSCVNDFIKKHAEGNFISKLAYQSDVEVEHNGSDLVISGTSEKIKQFKRNFKDAYAKDVITLDIQPSLFKDHEDQLSEIADSCKCCIQAKLAEDKEPCFEDVARFKDIKVKVEIASLVDQKEDVLVNTVHSSLELKKGSLSQQILKKAGNDIQDICKREYPDGIAAGDIAVTGPGNLKRNGVKWIFHCALPAFKKSTFVKNIKSIMRKCLCEMDKKRVETVAFPALGTGNLGYPIRETAKAMFDAVDEHRKSAIKSSVKKVVFVLHQADKNTCEVFCDEERRQKSKQNDKNKKQGFPKIFTDVGVAEGKVRLNVAKESDLRYFSSTVIVVDFIFMTGQWQKKPEMKPSSKEPKSWNDHLKVFCCNREDISSLLFAVSNVMEFCMKNKIFSILIPTCKEFIQTAVEQINVISQEVREYVKDNKDICLQNVFISVPDSDSLDDIEKQLNSGKGSVRDSSLDGDRWKLAINESLVDFIVVGETLDSTRQAADKLQDYVYSLESQKNIMESSGAIPKSSKPTWNSTEAISKGTVAQELPLVSSEMLPQNQAEQKWDTNDVSAEINPGIILYLKQQNMLELWKKEMQNTYCLEFLQKDSGVVVAKGSFKDIISFEQHLENKCMNIGNVSDQVFANQEKQEHMQPGKSETKPDVLAAINDVKNKQVTGQTNGQGYMQKDNKELKYQQYNTSEVMKKNYNENTSKCTLHINGLHITVFEGDITALPADCIVFYSNEKFEEVRDGKGLFVHVCCENNRQACTLCAKTGVLKLSDHRTIHGDKKVLHVLGQALSMEDLKDAIEMCLEEATRLNCSSVSMPVMISANTELKWTRMNLKKQKVFFNVILAGGMESDLKEATHDIVNLCTTADISGDSTEMDQKTDSNKNSNAKGKLENIRKGEDFLESKLRKYRKSVPLDVPIECIENRKDEIDREMNKRECVWNLKTIQKPVKMLKHCKYLASWIDPMRELKVTVVRGISWDMDLDLQIVMTNQSLYPIEIMQSQFKVPEDFILRGKDILERRGGKLNVGQYTELLKEVNGCENFNCVALVIASDFNNKTSKDLDIRQKIKEILTKHVKGNTTNFGLSAFEGGGAQKLTKQEIEAALEFADDSPGQIDEIFICHQTEQMQELQKLHELFKVKRGFVLNIYSDSAKVLKHTDSDTKIEVAEGSLEKLKADVMVNTTNSVLKLDEGGVSSSILKMAGSMIQKECKKKYPNGLKKGQIVKTNAYELKNLKFVYHISLPDYNMTTFREDVKAYVKKCLCQAERDECCSIVFPALGVGRLKYPQRETAEAMFDAAEEYSLNVINPVLKSIKFLVNVNDKMTYEAFRGEEYRRSKGCLKEIGLARPLIKKDFKALVFKTGQDSPSIKITSLQDFGIPPAYAIEVFSGHVKTVEEIYGKRASDEPHSWNDRWFLQKPESINNVTEGLGKLMNELAELDDRVTEIVIYTNKDSTCKISEEQQAKQICSVFSTTKTVFLQEVVIVVSDEPSLQRTATLLKKDVDRMNTNSRSTELSIELIGKTKEYLDDGETFITEFIQRIKQANTAYVVSRLPSSKNDFEVFDEVTADINPGIVDFKKQNNDWDA